MGSPQSFQVADAWPAYITCAIGLDRSWQADALCRKPGINENAVAWTGNIGSQIPRKGASLQRDMARTTCLVCPVQWECVKFAILTNDRWNVSAVMPKTRERLAEREDWEALVDMAKAAKMSVADLCRHTVEAAGDV